MPKLQPPFQVPKDRGLRSIASDSGWTDTTWRFDAAIAVPGTYPSLYEIRWDFRMHDGSKFDHLAWTGWREAAKIFVWSLLADPPEQLGPIRFGTSRGHLGRLLVLTKWMIENGFHALRELDREAQQRFFSHLAQKKGKGENYQLQPSTLGIYHQSLQTLFLQGLKYPELAIEEPSPKEARWKHHSGDRLPYTPDEIAVPLLRGALRLIGGPASDVIRLQTKAQMGYDGQFVEGKTRQDPAHDAALRAVADFEFATLPGEDNPWYQEPINSTEQIRFLVDRMYDAAFVLLSYLVGMRVSEILGLEAGCVVRESSVDHKQEFVFVKGRIYKTARSAGGSPTAGSLLTSSNERSASWSSSRLNCRQNLADPICG